MSSSVQPSGNEFGRARGLIAGCRWTFATTVPQAPHEYCVRDWLSAEQRAEFDWFVKLVSRHGYRGRFWGWEWTYLDVDDRKYWASRTLDRTGWIINRARIDDSALERQPSPEVSS